MKADRCHNNGAMMRQDFPNWQSYWFVGPPWSNRFANEQNHAFIGSTSLCLGTYGSTSPVLANVANMILGTLVRVLYDDSQY